MDKTYNFRKFKTIAYYGTEIYNNDLTLHDALEQQIRLKDDICIFEESTKNQYLQALQNAIILLKGTLVQI